MPVQAGYETIRPNLLEGMGGVESTIQAINGPINSIVWGWPTVLLIAATGILLMVGHPQTMLLIGPLMA